MKKRIMTNKGNIHTIEVPMNNPTVADCVSIANCYLKDDEYIIAIDYDTEEEMMESVHEYENSMNATLCCIEMGMGLPTGTLKRLDYEEFKEIDCVLNDIYLNKDVSKYSKMKLAERFANGEIDYDDIYDFFFEYCV